MDNKNKQGGRRPGAGRKKKERVAGDEPKNTTVQIEPSIALACRIKYGSLANALRFAANK
jgi:ribosomal protein S8E